MIIAQIVNILCSSHSDKDKIEMDMRSTEITKATVLDNTSNPNICTCSSNDSSKENSRKYVLGFYKDVKKLLDYSKGSVARASEIAFEDSFENYITKIFEINSLTSEALIKLKLKLQENLNDYESDIFLPELNLEEGFENVRMVVNNSIAAVKMSIFNQFNDFSIKDDHKITIELKDLNRSLEKDKLNAIDILINLNLNPYLLKGGNLSTMVSKSILIFIEVNKIFTGSILTEFNNNHDIINEKKTETNENDEVRRRLIFRLIQSLKLCLNMNNNMLLEMLNGFIEGITGLVIDDSVSTIFLPIKKKSI